MLHPLHLILYVRDETHKSLIVRVVLQFLLLWLLLPRVCRCGWEGRMLEGGQLETLRETVFLP